MIWTVTNYLPVLSTDSFVKVDEKCFHPTLATVTQHDMHCDIMVEFGFKLQGKLQGHGPGDPATHSIS